MVLARYAPDTTKYQAKAMSHGMATVRLDLKLNTAKRLICWLGAAIC